MFPEPCDSVWIALFYRLDLRYFFAADGSFLSCCYARGKFHNLRSRYASLLAVPDDEFEGNEMTNRGIALSKQEADFQAFGFIWEISSLLNHQSHTIIIATLRGVSVRAIETVCATRNSSQSYEFLKYSTAALSSLMALSFDQTADAAFDAQDVWIEGSVSRFDIVPHFFDKLVSDDPKSARRLQQILPRLKILVTTQKDGHQVHEATNREELKDLITKTTWM